MRCSRRYATPVSWLAGMLTALAVFLSMPLPVAAADAPAEPELTGSEMVYLYNLDYDTELKHSEFTDAQGRDISIYPASTVKLMTGLIACEELGGRMSEQLTVTATMLNGVVGNNMGLKVGEVVTVQDMLYGLLTNCANDAAQVIAITLAGSVDGFVARMNARAETLGMYNTRYMNPTGMHDDRMVTTLRDSAILAKAAAANSLLVTASSEVKYVMGKTNLTEYRNLYNRNYLISTFHNSSGTDYRYSGIRGLNAGYTVQGGYCVMTTATRGNLTYLCIVMGGKEKEDGSITSYELTRALLDWAFAAYKRVEVLSSETLIDEIPVTLSVAVDYVKLRASLPEGQEAVSCYLPADTDLEKDITYNWYTFEPELQAPVKEGTKVGSVTVLYKGEMLCSADLVTAADVARSDLLYTMQRIKRFTGTVFFWATVIAAVVLSLVYILLQAGQEERAARHQGKTVSPVNLSVMQGRRPGRAVRRPPRPQEQAIPRQRLAYGEGRGRTEKGRPEGRPASPGKKPGRTDGGTGRRPPEVPPVNFSRRR